MNLHGATDLALYFKNHRNWLRRIRTDINEENSIEISQLQQVKYISIDLNFILI